MKKLCLSLLIFIILSLTINFKIYSTEVDMTFNPSTILTSERQTSNGWMIELSKDNYYQWLTNYRFLLIENISQKTTINQWEKQYNQLLEDTVWKDSYNEVILYLNQTEIDYQKEKQKTRLLTYSLIGSSLFIILETIILIVR